MQVVCETIWGSPEVSSLPWALVTMCNLVIAYGIGMAVPDIWPVMVRTLQYMSHTAVHMRHYWGLLSFELDRAT